MREEHFAKLAAAFDQLAAVAEKSEEARQNMSVVVGKDLEILRDGQMRMAAAFEGTQVLIRAIMPMLQDILDCQGRLEARLEALQPQPPGGQAPR